MEPDSKQFLERLARTAQTTKENLRIQMGSRVVYGQTARGFRNELPHDRLKALSERLQQPVTAGVDESTYTKRQPEIEIKAGDKVVFRQERDGTFTVNSFQQQLQVEHQDPQQAVLEAPLPTEVGAPLAASEGAEHLPDQAQQKLPEVSSSQKQTDEPKLNNAQELTVGSVEQASVVKAGFLEKKSQTHIAQPPRPGQSQVQTEVAEHSPIEINSAPSLPVPKAPSRSQTASFAAQPELGAAQVAQQQAEKLPPGQTQQYIKALTQELGKRALQAVNGLASLPQWKRERDVANTALQLFNHNYKQTGEQSYQAENYKISLHGLDNYSISDRTGRELMRFKAGGLTGPSILDNRMNKLQYQDFNQARSQIQRLGGVNGISKDPQQRLSQLGNLAPFGDREVLYATKIKQVVQTARDYLRGLGVSEVKAGQQGNYSIESRGDDYLRLESQQDQRGTVLLIENGTLKSDLESKDFSHFKQLHNSMQKQASRTDSQQPVVKKSETEILLTNSQLRNVAAVITAQNVLDSLGTNTYESDKYRFERLGDVITLAAKDGRGEIARMESGHVTGQLSNQDAVFLSQMNRAVMPHLLQSSEFPMATTQTQARLTLLSQTAPNESLTRAKDIELGE